MRRLPLLFVALLLLVSCGGGGNGPAVTCKEQFWDGTVGVCLPAYWRVIERGTLLERGIPEDVIVAFKREKAMAGQFPTVTVTQEALNSPTDPAAYSRASVRSVSVLPGYAMIDSKSEDVDGTTVDVHIFSAKPAEDQPAHRFYQISTVAGTYGYSVTSVVPLSPSKDVEAEVQAMMQSVTFKDPRQVKAE